MISLGLMRDIIKRNKYFNIKYDYYIDELEDKNISYEDFIDYFLVSILFPYLNKKYGVNIDKELNEYELEVGIEYCLDFIDINEIV